MASSRYGHAVKLAKRGEIDAALDALEAAAQLLERCPRYQRQWPPCLTQWVFVSMAMAQYARDGQRAEKEVHILRQAMSIVEQAFVRCPGLREIRQFSEWEPWAQARLRFLERKVAANMVALKAQSTPR